MVSYESASDHGRFWFLLPLLAGVTTFAGCDNPAALDRSRRPTEPPPIATFSTTSVIELDTGAFVRIIQGAIGPGALYALYIPRIWNGDAIHYVHGNRDVASPVDLRNQANFFAVRDALGARGYAIAYSSWSANGLVVKNGADDVHQLRGILTAALPRPPQRSFVLGYSLGGLVAIDLLETYPAQYDGALTLCGMLGGLAMETEYYANVRMLFDLYYPGMWPGNVLWTPPDAPLPTLNQLTAIVEANPTPLFLIASLEQTPLAYRPSGDVHDTLSIAFHNLVNSLYTALSGSNGSRDYYDLTHGHDFIDNSTTTYSLAADPLLPSSVLQPMVDFVNAHVARYTADPSGANYLNRYYTPTGDIRIPVLALHTSWDPTNPVFHEAAFHDKVIAVGKGGNLVQRFYPAYGHTTALPTGVIVQNFLDMVNWVTSGVKPAN